MDSCKAKKNRKWRDWHLLWLPHWVLFPLWQYLFLFKGNIVHLNCSPMVTEDGMKGSVLTAQLYGGDIDISVNVMPHQHLEYDLWTPTSEIFSFFFYWQHVSLIPGGLWEASLTYQVRGWAAVIEQKRICLRANKVSTLHPYSVSFFIAPHFELRLPTAEVFSHLLTPPAVKSP